MILLIDNYDSFTFNVEQYLGELHQKVKTIRNDQITLLQIEKMKPEAIVISPGPGSPDEAGITLSLIQEFAGKIPILGICLGHQAIGQAFGGKVARAPRMMHGKLSSITHDGKGLFRALPKSFDVTRYHSLHVEAKSLPSVLKVTAKTEDGIIMGLRHKKFKIEGVQFHPESYLTEHGHKMLENFLSLALD
ncbi:MAG: aminodeoxychorismate/anthranilate synthase component II [Proteobacteria bacterium]|nr:MAG: aminodeoxychorismate/anthranilate synthase component II [Pseudomonadota bacterium]